MFMQQLIDQFDWSATPIGPRESWPQSLRTALSICVASRFPILIWWGEELTMLYNDAYAEMLGGKHPQAIGAPGRRIWGEIWDVIGPMLDQVTTEGKATWSDDQLLIVDRYGYPEETYFTFSYSPIRDESGGVGGIFTAVTETTPRVLSERRLDTLRRLAAAGAEARTVESACTSAAETLRGNPKDIPFAAIYLRSPEGEGRLVAVAGDMPGEPPHTFDWSAPPAICPDRALTIPLHRPGEEEAAGTLIAGISPNRALDDEYRAFFSMVAGHIATAITDARAYEMERERAEALAALDRAKTAFFSNVSHEFRTPLTLMLGPIEDVLASSEPTAHVRDRLDVAHRNALRLLKLVNNLLDFSRIEAGRIEAAYEPVELCALTKELTGVFRSAIERAGLRLVVDCQPLGEPVYVDREMWEKVVFNLLSNALKFTFDGEIEVALRRDGDRAVLSVRDTGTGIPADELPHVFERFHRVRNARGRTYEGSGIGLALVDELAKLHGGSVAAVSEVDRGSTFTVSIPFGTDHLPTERIGAQRTLESTAARSDAFVEEALRWLPAKSREPHVHEDGGASRGRVLLADDNADMREYVRQLLGSVYEVEAVADGAAALAAARRRVPGLVLADVMMPGLDGFELLHALREDEDTREVPVILLSARAGEESRVEGLESGADDYLTKPFSARELLARVGSHFRLQSIRRETQAAVRASEAMFSVAFGRSPLPLAITSLDDGRIIEINEAFSRLFGYTREEVVGRTPDELGMGVDPQTREERFARMRAGHAVPDVEARFRVKSGQDRIGVIGSAVVEINGRRCVLTSVTDITERKRAEEAIRESEKQLREFADTAPAMLWITEPDGLCSFVSRGWYEFTGQIGDEPLGFGWTAAIHDDDRVAARDAFVTANAAHEPFSIDFRIRHVSGEYRWVNGSGRPRFSNGQFLGFVGSVIDITARKHAEQAKDEFMATLSHELRTPLTSGFGWVKLLGRAHDPELVETGLRAIEESFVNQMKLVDDLLDISRIAAGKLHLDRKSIDIGTVVHAAVETVRPAAEAKGVSLQVQAHAVLAVNGDAARLKQVFWNLLSNALKFTPAGGTVSVELRRRRGHAEVVVRDSGEGIDPRFLPHVFDRFRQADASTTRKHGGLGIGLSIVSSLVAAHDGQVRAESDGRGKGATFIVTLPLQGLGVAIVPPQPAEAPSAGAPRLAGARILVVDDDDGARQVMVATLEAAGAEVRACSSVRDAHEMVTAWTPDLLISDLAMPHEDGYSLIRSLRETGNLLPALAITAYVRPEDEARVRDAGFQRHVAKPFDPEELVKAVGELTG